MSKIIIGIHGLGNKPPERTLAAWWKASIREGLKGTKKEKSPFRFRLVYWAGYLNPEPLNPEIEDRNHPLYLEDPYIPCISPRESAEEHRSGEFRKRVLHYLEEQMERIFLNEDLSINYSAINDFIIGRFFRDLESYYSGGRVLRDDPDRTARDAICSQLAGVLTKHRRKKILLIAHSMGSIIAYDVLTQFVPSVPVHTFVTIGSPLGLPVIKSRIVAELRKKGFSGTVLKTPENVASHWYNLSDVKDKVCLDYDLSDDFEENSRHVRVIDRFVTNDYEYMGEKNPHKSYGYLRTPEMAQIIAGFLGKRWWEPFFRWKRYLT